MDRYLTATIFSADPTQNDPDILESHQLRTAAEVGFREAWLQRAIATNPELVIAPCREAGLTDEQWLFWASEFSFEPGKIDVLLVSNSARVAIVETKLSYNAEARRTVVAQLLEYAVHLPFIDTSDLPPIPEVNGRKFVEDDLLRSRLEEGDYLLIVAGDRLDSRAVRLSKYLLGKHLVYPWDLALVEVAVFQRRAANEFLLVPHLRGTVVREERQVVRVVVSGDRNRVDRTRVEIEETTQPAGVTLTWEQILSQCRDEHSRKLLTIVGEQWESNGHEIRPGTVGAGMWANIGGQMQPVFRAFPERVQLLFSELERRGVSKDALQEYRQALALMKGLDASKVSRAWTQVFFEALTERDLNSLLESILRFVNQWSGAASKQQSTTAS